MKTTIAIITAIVMMVGMSSGMSVTMSGGNNGDTETVYMGSYSQSPVMTNMQSVSMDMSGPTVDIAMSMEFVSASQETHATKTVTRGHTHVHNTHINRNEPTHAIGTHIINIDGDITSYTVNGVPV